jgi:hypothetical protein
MSIPKILKSFFVLMCLALSPINAEEVRDLSSRETEGLKAMTEKLSAKFAGEKKSYTIVDLIEYCNHGMGIPILPDEETFSILVTKPEILKEVAPLQGSSIYSVLKQACQLNGLSFLINDEYCMICKSKQKIKN